MSRDSLTSNKVAIVTGVSRGLGQYIAHTFLKNSWTVIGTGRSERPASLDPKIDYHRFDTSNSEKCNELLSGLAMRYKSAEFCLINNAGGYVGGSLAETSPEEYQNQMNSIYFSAVYMTQALVKNINRAKIINVISTGALNPQKNNSAYGSAKVAEMHFFQALQKELPKSNYEITNLYPDVIASSGPMEHAIDASELSELILKVAEADKSYYLSDVTIRFLAA